MNESIDLSQTGVYCITNTVNGKRYVGSAAKSFELRWRQHRNRLRRGSHHSRHLQGAWIQYGESAFEFSVLIVCDPDDCVRMEQVYIDTFNSANEEFGYNICPNAGSSLGFKMTEQTREKMRGRVITQEERRRRSELMKGRIVRPEVLAKRIGKKRTKEQRERIAAALRGKPKSPEHCRRMSDSLTGRKLTDEQRAAIARGHLGQRPTAETLAKRSAKLRGQKRTPEQIERMRIAQRESRAARKSAA